MIKLDMTLFYPLYGILALQVIDVSLGVAKAIVCKQFSFKLLPQYLYTKVLAYDVPLVAMAGVLNLTFPGKEAIMALYVASVASYFTALLSEIKDKVKRIFDVRSG